LQHGTGVIVRIPLLFGFLSGKFNSRSTFSKNDHRRFNLSEEKIKSYQNQLKDFEKVFETYKEYSPAQLSLRFCLSHPAAHVAIPGGKTAEQVKENLVASDLDHISYDDFFTN